MGLLAAIDTEVRLTLARRGHSIVQHILAWDRLPTAIDTEVGLTSALRCPGSLQNLSLYGTLFRRQLMQKSV